MNDNMDAKAYAYWPYELSSWRKTEVFDGKQLRQLWDEDFWQEIFSQNIVDEWDRLIDAFNNHGDKK